MSRKTHKDFNVGDLFLSDDNWSRTICILVKKSQRAPGCPYTFEMYYYHMYKVEKQEFVAQEYKQIVFWDTARINRYIDYRGYKHYAAIK